MNNVGGLTRQAPEILAISVGTDANGLREASQRAARPVHKGGLPIWQAPIWRGRLVVAPICTEPPFPIGTGVEAEGIERILVAMRLVVAINLLGLPAAAVPVGIEAGLPQAVQVIGRRVREDTCLDMVGHEAPCLIALHAPTRIPAPRPRGVARPSCSPRLARVYHPPGPWSVSWGCPCLRRPPSRCPTRVCNRRRWRGRPSGTCGHDAYQDRPARFLANVRAFLAGAPPPDAVAETGPPDEYEGPPFGSRRRFALRVSLGSPRSASQTCMKSAES